jgi:uncharacterized protein YdhG (YjbR/CyaY superfamily)
VGQNGIGKRKLDERRSTSSLPQKNFLIKYIHMTAIKPRNIDEYIARFPKNTQRVLQQIRATIKKAAPRAEETISYSIPTFTLNKTYLLYFAGYKKHVSLYPAPSGNEAFEKEISVYRSGKGPVQFSLEKPLPLNLIAKIVKYSIKANLERTKANKK